MEDFPESEGIENRTPIDGVLASLIKESAEQKDGFALSVARKLVDGKESVTFTVQPPTPVHDVWEAPAAYRAHTVEDVTSLASLAAKYSDPGRGIVFYNDGGAVLVYDENPTVGQREKIILQFAYSAEWLAWQSVIGRVQDHRSLLTHCIQNQHTLASPSMLDALRSVKANFNAKFDSDLREMKEEVGIVFTATAGDELVRFPKRIDITLPVLDLDVNNRTATATMRLEFKLPTEPKQPVTFQLLCPEWNAIRRERIDVEIEALKSLMGPKWTIVRGVHRENARALPK